MRIGALKVYGLAAVLAALACLPFVSGLKPKAPARELLNSLLIRAEKGDAGAQLKLGVMYEKGSGVTRDYAYSVHWYRQAAERGIAEAQSFLGLMYEEGKGVPRDHAEALRWFRKAAEQGYTNAQSMLGIMYYERQDATRDYVEAYTWMSLAASSASGDDRKRAAELLDRLATIMTSQQIAEAQRRAREWKPNPSRPPEQ
jgi:TPR repeat protein